MMNHRFGHHHMDQVIGINLLNIIMVLLILMAVVVVTILIVKRQSPTRTPTKPIEILKERFASGDIDEDEYRRRKKILEEEQNQ